jgi:hypothetical protein
MNKNKKQRIVVISALALMIAVPITVLAIVYNSGRTNTFRPAEADIAVKESNAESEMLTDQDYTMSLSDDDIYSVSKPVEIKDLRSNGGENLRVRFVPMWIDSDGNVCGGVADVTDIRDIELDAEETKLIYYNGSGSSRSPLIVLELAENWKDNGWTFNRDDSCFIYSGALDENKLTSKLLSKVTVSKEVMDKAEGLELQLDVLADAIQKYGGAESRWE